MTIRQFDQQVETYVAAGFAAAAGLEGGAFRQRLEPLRAAFESAPHDEFSPVIVLKRDFATPGQLVSGIDREDGKPETVIREDSLVAYAEREGVALPEGDAYVLAGVSKEPETRDVAPGEVLEQFAGDGRSPLTIEEGLAIWRQFPDVIAVNDGISLAGSTPATSASPRSGSVRRPRSSAGASSACRTPGSPPPPASTASAQSTSLASRARERASMATWRNGYAAACKAVYTGSIPVVALMPERGTTGMVLCALACKAVYTGSIPVVAF